jgi:hypothetical protein
MLGINAQYGKHGKSLKLDFDFKALSLHYADDRGGGFVA